MYPSDELFMHLAECYDMLISLITVGNIHQNNPLVSA